MKTIKDDLDFCLKCDVFILADVFEKFTSNSSKNYVLCLSHYLSALGINWDAMLKTTKVAYCRSWRVHILWKSTRGGISYISNRYNKVNNKYLKLCDPKQESKHIIYLDTNYLCGYAISRFLPTKGFNG